MLPAISDRRAAQLAALSTTKAETDAWMPDPDQAGPTVGLVSLGCPKNLVDSEKLLGALAAGGFVPTGDPAEAEILLVNTCGFVEDAKQESIDALLEMAEFKETGRCRYLVATGCLTQRYADQLREAMPEVDAWFGFEAYNQIDRELRDLYSGRLSGVPVRVSDPGAVVEIEAARLRLTPAHYAYLRISEGCDKTCSFCSIPSFRGKFRSKSIESLVAEAHELVASGAREINLVSQDTLQYGVDLHGRPAMAELVERLCEVDGLDWLRLWYLYPGPLPPGLLEQIVGQEKVVPYLDVPIQHADDTLLRAMRRPPLGRAGQILHEMREAIPGLVLRTSAIVGFPGETEAAFETLVDWVRDVGFERLGVFVYSQEDGTPAAELPDQVEEAVKLDRHRRLTQAAAELLEAAQRARVGRTERVLIDEMTPRGLVGRTTGEGPDVDPVVRLPADRGAVGDMVDVEIVGLDGLDLVAR